MTTWLADNRQHKHGVHHYAAQDFHLDVRAWHDRFQFYYDRFGVREEPDRHSPQPRAGKP